MTPSRLWCMATMATAVLHPLVPRPQGRLCPALVWMYLCKRDCWLDRLGGPDGGAVA